MVLGFIGLFIIIAGMYIAEGYHDASIERVQKTGDMSLIEAWHKNDSIFHVFMNVGFSFGMFVFVPLMMGVNPMWLNATAFGIMLLGMRQIFMVIPLNLFRKRKPFYIGNTAKFDKLVKGKEWLIFGLAGLVIIGCASYILLFSQFLSVLA